MTRDELIAKCTHHLNAADGCVQTNTPNEYSENMTAILDLLLEELVGNAPEAQAKEARTFNPERVLEQIAMAIKHRTISDTHRWKIIYYHTRITCVPIKVDVPERIVLHEFTDKMANDGFSTIYWNQLKQNVLKLYKEFES